MSSLPHGRAWASGNVQSFYAMITDYWCCAACLWISEKLQVADIWAFVHHDHDGREPSAMTAVELSFSVETAEGGVFGGVKLFGLGQNGILLANVFMAPDIPCLSAPEKRSFWRASPGFSAFYSPELLPELAEQVPVASAIFCPLACVIELQLQSHAWRVVWLQRLQNRQTMGSMITCLKVIPFQWFSCLCRIAGTVLV